MPLYYMLKFGDNMEELNLKKELFKILQEYKVLINQCESNNYEEKINDLNKLLDDLLLNYDFFSKEFLNLIRKYKILNILTIGIYSKLNLYEYERLELLGVTLGLLKISHDSLLEEYALVKKLQYENRNNLNSYKKNRDEISLFLEM